MPRDTRARRNTERFREANERIASLGSRWESAEHVGFLCECSETGCRSTVYLTVAEFREIRETQGCYVTAPGHADSGGERVVVAGRYTVVEAREAPATGRERSGSRSKG